jgi:hypothetical protein
MSQPPWRAIRQGRTFSPGRVSPSGLAFGVFHLRMEQVRLRREVSAMGVTTSCDVTNEKTGL